MAQPCPNNVDHTVHQIILHQFSLAKVLTFLRDRQKQKPDFDEK